MKLIYIIFMNDSLIQCILNTAWNIDENVYNRLLN